LGSALSWPKQADPYEGGGHTFPKRELAGDGVWNFMGTDFWQEAADLSCVTMNKI